VAKNRTALFFSHFVHFLYPALGLSDTGPQGRLKPTLVLEGNRIIGKALKVREGQNFPCRPVCRGHRHRDHLSGAVSRLELQFLGQAVQAHIPRLLDREDESNNAATGISNLVVRDCRVLIQKDIHDFPLKAVPTSSVHFPAPFPNFNIGRLRHGFKF